MEMNDIEIKNILTHARGAIYQLQSLCKDLEGRVHPPSVLTADEEHILCILCSVLPEMYEGRNGIKTSEILALLKNHPFAYLDMFSVVCALCHLSNGELPSAPRLGMDLRRISNRSVDGKRLERVSTYSRVAMWRVVEIA